MSRKLKKFDLVAKKTLSLGLPNRSDTATEDGKRLEISDLERRVIVLSM